MDPLSTNGATLTKEATESMAPLIRIVCWFLVSISGLFLSLRLYCKYLQSRGLWWDDHVLVMAWVCPPHHPPLSTAHKSNVAPPARPSSRHHHHHHKPRPRLRPPPLRHPAPRRPDHHPSQQCLHLARLPRRRLEQDVVRHDAAAHNRRQDARHRVVRHGQHERGRVGEHRRVVGAVRSAAQGVGQGDCCRGEVLGSESECLLHGVCCW